MRRAVFRNRTDRRVRKSNFLSSRSSPRRMTFLCAHFSSLTPYPPTGTMAPAKQQIRQILRLSETASDEEVLSQGSLTPVTETAWIYDQQADRLTRRDVRYVPAILNTVTDVFRELAALQPAVTPRGNIHNTIGLSFDIDRASGRITMESRGGKLLPFEMINLWKGERKCTLPPAMSTACRQATSFKLTMALKKNRKGQAKLIQAEWNNGGAGGTPEVTLTKMDHFVRIIFTLNFDKFGVQQLCEDTIALIETCLVLYQSSAFMRNHEKKLHTNLKLNGQKLNGGVVWLAKQLLGEHNLLGHNLRFARCLGGPPAGRFEVAIAISHTGFQHYSCINSFHTPDGGTHLELIADLVTTWLADQLNSGTTVHCSPEEIKQHLWLYANLHLDKPEFESAQKRRLTTPSSTFAADIVLPKSLLTGCARYGIVAYLKQQLTRRSRALPATLIDAATAGPGSEATLILTEGKSASAAVQFAIDKKQFGVLPLWHQASLTRGGAFKRIFGSSALADLMAAVDLDVNHRYEEESEKRKLRYHRILLMFDPDYAGSLRQQSLFVLIRQIWPALIEAGFIQNFIFPTHKVEFASSDVVLYFDSGADFRRWQEEQHSGGEKYTVQAFKSVPNFSPRDISNIFAEHQSRITTLSNEPSTKIYLTPEQLMLCDSEKFSAGAAVSFLRYLSSLVDGLRKTQRLLIGTLLNEEKSTMAVQHLAGLTAEKDNYLSDTRILERSAIKTAQIFAGRSNLNLLSGIGFFGSRPNCGKDAAQPRYLTVELSPAAEGLFPKDDRFASERHLWPVVPTVLFTSASWYSVALYNPFDVVGSIRTLIREGQTAQLPALLPYFRGFKGRVEWIDQTHFLTTGNATVEGRQIVIDELPIGESIKHYTERVLEPLLAKNFITSYSEAHTLGGVHFQISLPKPSLDKAVSRGLLKKFRLTKKHSARMYLLDATGRPVRYDTAQEVIRAFYPIRLAAYEQRRQNLMRQLEAALRRNELQTIFIYHALKGVVKMGNLTEQLAALRYLPDPDESKQPYDHLLAVPCGQISRTELVRLTEEHDVIEAQLQQLRNTPIEALWLEDLDKCNEYLEEDHGRFERDLEMMRQTSLEKATAQWIQEAEKADLEAVSDDDEELWFFSDEEEEEDEEDESDLEMPEPTAMAKRGDKRKTGQDASSIRRSTRQRTQITCYIDTESE